MKTIKLTQKELDAIDTMLEYWYGVNKWFMTRNHGKFTEKNQESLIRKIGFRGWK